MSEIAKRTFCQSIPIPLSVISDPTHRSPFSKLPQFQVDLDISVSNQQQQPGPSLWRNLESTLTRAMSTLVVIAHSVAVASSGPMLSRPTSSVDPWKSSRPWDLGLSDEPQVCPSTSEKALPETFFCPLLSDSSFSAPSTHPHHRSSAQFPIPNLFYLAMSGLLTSCPQCPDRVNSFYSNCYLSSPLNLKGLRSLSMPSSPQKSRSLATPALSPTSEAEIEIITHSVSTSEDQFCSKLQCSSPTPPTQGMSGEAGCTRMDNSKLLCSSPPPTQGMSGEAGCTRMDNKWRTKNAMSSCQEEVSVANFQAVSVCSPSSPTKGGGTLTFSCSSTSSPPPKAMAKPCDPRRRKTESESSTDSSSESTDSFCIVFEPVGGCIDVEVLDWEEEDDDDGDWQDEDSADEDDSYEEEDPVFNYSNSSDDVFFMDAFDLGADHVDFTLQPELLKTKKLKRVSFKEENLERVIEFEDDTESKNCRDKYWEMVARDRARFQDRIFRTGDILEPILEPAHRSKVFHQRFWADK